MVAPTGARPAIHVQQGVVVFPPELAEEALAEAKAQRAPRVAYMQADHDLLVAAGAYAHVAVLADAYASDEASVAAAVAYAAAERREARSRGPLRLTYLGSLGQLRPPTAPPIGGAVPIHGATRIGRLPSCEIVLRSGPHSDQNTVARVHASVEPSPGGLRVLDLSSTNGTWVGGRRVRDIEVQPGEEIAIACTHRFRVDGEP